MSSHQQPPWAEHPDLVAFYTQHRKRPEDLYPSERRFLPWLAKQGTSVLDMGCAAGGFRNIWCHYQPDIIYAGVDLSTSLISAARKLHPDVAFYQGDCVAGLSLPDRYATVVSALGWLHWESQYEKAIRELWRVSDRYLFFDVRLVGKTDQAVSGKQQLAFIGPWDGETTTPYICVAWPILATQLIELQPMTIFGYGYWGKPAETVMGVDQQVCFATFVVEKVPVGEDLRLPIVCIDLPLPWPAALANQVNLLPASQLDALVPQV
jgi:SAM-dependent methyltransferase